MGFWTSYEVGFVLDSTPQPPNTVHISSEYHTQLGIEQAKGGTIIWGDDGYPYVEPHVFDEDEILAENIRLDRDIRLKTTDWTQLPDTPDPLKKKYAEYRQALRDIPQQPGFPHDVIWPTEPK